MAMRNLTIGLLLFVSLAALYGGTMLMQTPTGETMQMQVEWLKFSPFKDYFYPGLILFTFNGLFSAAVIIMILTRHQLAHPMIFAQGAILIIWILMRILLVEQSSFLVIIFGAIGVTFLFLGTKRFRAW
jgi:hypothetical protein